MRKRLCDILDFSYTTVKLLEAFHIIQVSSLRGAILLQNMPGGETQNAPSISRRTIVAPSRCYVCRKERP